MVQSDLFSFSGPDSDTRIIRRLPESRHLGLMLCGPGDGSMVGSLR